jgi:hypothetical protein
MLDVKTGDLTQRFQRTLNAASISGAEVLSEDVAATLCGCGVWENVASGNAGLFRSI